MQPYDKIRILSTAGKQRDALSVSLRLTAPKGRGVAAVGGDGEGSPQA